jgi:hypothetical protein
MGTRSTWSARPVRQRRRVGDRTGWHTVAARRIIHDRVDSLSPPLRERQQLQLELDRSAGPEKPLVAFRWPLCRCPPCEDSVTISRRSFVEPLRGPHSPLSLRRVRPSPLAGDQRRSHSHRSRRLRRARHWRRSCNAVECQRQRADHGTRRSLPRPHGVGARRGFDARRRRDPSFAAAYKVTPTSASPASMRTRRCWPPTVTS